MALVLIYVGVRLFHRHSRAMLWIALGLLFIMAMFGQNQELVVHPEPAQVSALPEPMPSNGPVLEIPQQMQVNR
jgi:hypothetical protein